MSSRGFRSFVVLSVLTAQLASQGLAAPSDRIAAIRNAVVSSRNAVVSSISSRSQKIFSFFSGGSSHNEPTPIDQRNLERSPKFLSDREFLTERRYSSDTLGVVDTRFVPAIDTRIYYTATARPDEQGNIPALDPEAKGLFIFFHGSGTVKAGGGNFTLKMNRLAQLGYGALGFDFPWHQDGSQNPSLTDSTKFMEYLYNVIQTLRPGNKPIYLVGHSFGPEIVSELVTRYPYLVQGAALISPGGFDEVTTKWYNEKTTKMPFMADLQAGGDNRKGGEWAGAVTKSFVWNKPSKRADPTLVNPRLNLHVIYGDQEEYIPGPLLANGAPAPVPRTYDVCAVYKTFFAGIRCTVEAGVGHYIFEHKDADGNDVIMRTLLELAGESIADEKAIKQAHSQHIAKTRSNSENNLSYYSKDIFFRQWIDRSVGKAHLVQLRNDKNEKASQLLYNDFKMVMKQRDLAILENIRKTKETAPEFYATVEVAMATSESKGFEATAVIAKYLQFLASPEGLKLMMNPSADESVYALPEKKQQTRQGNVRVPDAAEIEARRAEKQRQKAEKAGAAPSCSQLTSGSTTPALDFDRAG